MALRTPAFNDSKTYGFEWLRYMLEVSDMQEGVLNAGDLKTTAAAGGGMKADVAAGACVVKGDSGTPGVGLSQGLFLVVNDAAIPNAVTFSASDPTNPRLDQVCMRVRDSTDLGTGADDATLVIVQGTPAAGATLDNRNGNVALPNDHVRLADVLIPAASVAVTAGNVRDRRPWARGAFVSKSQNAGGAYATASGTYVVIDATNIAGRVECSGVPLRVKLIASGFHTVASGAIEIAPFVDAAAIAAIPGDLYQTASPGVSVPVPIVAEGVFTPAAGSHVIDWRFRTATGANANITRSSLSPVIFLVEELVRQNADNT